LEVSSTGRRFQGKVAIVTGAGVGIGEATAKRFAAEGAAVVVTSFRDHRAARVASEITADGGQAISRGGDVSSEDDVRGLVRMAVDTWGRLDILVNNAAATGADLMSHEAPVVDLEREFFLRTLEVDLIGVFLGCKHAIPEMLKVGGGAIVNTSSQASMGAVSPPRVAYGSAKAGVEALTRYVAAHYGKDSIRCNAVAPGWTMSDPMLEKYPADARTVVEHGIAAPRLGRPEDQAGVITFLASEDAAFVNGHCIPAGGGELALTPTGALQSYAIANGVHEGRSAIHGGAAW
jgi:NAD(P)-dependent dehydrogenase (short-subunit alcohol dehydrogenase family)